MVVTEVERVRMTGNAFSNDAMWAIIRQWRVPGVRLQTVMVAVKRTAWSHEQHLAHYGNIPREQVRLELTAMGESLEMPKLKLADMIGRQHTVPFQTDAPGFVNKKYAVSAEYMCECTFKDNSHTRVEYDCKM